MAEFPCTPIEREIGNLIRAYEAAERRFTGGIRSIGEMVVALRALDASDCSSIKMGAELDALERLVTEAARVPGLEMGVVAAPPPQLCLPAGSADPSDPSVDMMLRAGRCERRQRHHDTMARAPCPREPRNDRPPPSLMPELAELWVGDRGPLDVTRTVTDLGIGEDTIVSIRPKRLAPSLLARDCPF